MSSPEVLGSLSDTGALGISGGNVNSGDAMIFNSEMKGGTADDADTRG
jgi:hypothetical protein